MPLPDGHSHIELAKWVFGMLMAMTVLEIAGTKQVTAAGLNVVCFHPPRGPGWGRRHQKARGRSQAKNADVCQFHARHSFPMISAGPAFVIPVARGNRFD